jgi:CheY-like chemotaxis protein
MRVVIADDAVLFREGLARVLESAGIQVVGQVSDADRLLAQVRADPPDAVVVDIRMPPTHTSEGLDAARRIRGEHAPVGVLVLSRYVEPHHAVQLLEDGASGVGYLLKDRVANVGGRGGAPRRLGWVGDRPRGGRPARRPATHPQSHPGADRARMSGTRAHGGRTVQPSHLRTVIPQPQDRGGTRPQHLHPPRPTRHPRRPPPRPRRPCLPPSVIRPTTPSTMATGGYEAIQATKATPG